MSCDEIRKHFDTLWEGEPAPELRQHLAECVACGQSARDVRLVRAGLQVLKHEVPPDPSPGFAERLVRQLSELGKQAAMGEFFEQAGRRFVYATLVLAFLMLLALAVPESGPVRGQAAADWLTPAQEATLVRPDPLEDVSDTLPTDAQPPSASQEEGK